MSVINFEFVKKIDEKRINNKNCKNRKKIYIELIKSTELLKDNPKQAISNIHLLLKDILIDILEKEKIQNSKNQSFEDKLNNLKSNIDRKDRFICDMFKMIYLTQNDYNKSNLDVDYEWVNLCMEYVYMICKWYGEKYYNIKVDNRVQVVSKPKIVSNEDFIINISNKNKVIEHEQARIAYKNLRMNISNRYDALVFLASANLVNAYVKQENAILFMKPKYVFKSILVEKLEEMIIKNVEGVKIYFNVDTTYIKVLNLQFSFKYLPTNDFMKKYITCGENKVQSWEGMKLQPCAGDILEQTMKIQQGFIN